MSPRGAPDPLYVIARKVLLDALEALAPHREAIVLVGAQAVYLHAGDADVSVAPFTTDADLALDPRKLGDDPLLEDALQSAGFRIATGAIGVWEASVPVADKRITVALDLLVPDSLGGKGRRAAKLPPHGHASARKAVGLEAAMVDHDIRDISALANDDARHFVVAVAGPAALIVAKVHKILDRETDADRLSDKDALDILRLLQEVPLDDLARRFALLPESKLARGVTEKTLDAIPTLFGSTRATGALMAARGAGSGADGEIVAASLVSLARDLSDALRRELQ